MIFSRRAALNGDQLDEIHDAIVIRGIEQAAGKDNITATATGGPFGQRITGARRDSIDITVKFAIDIKKRDLEGRNAVLEAVNAWAAAARTETGGAWLTVGHKPDRRIRVVLAQPAAEGDLWKWTDDFTIIFRAYGVPYWEQSEANTVSTGRGRDDRRERGNAGERVYPEHERSGDQYGEHHGRRENDELYRAGNGRGRDACDRPYGRRAREDPDQDRRRHVPERDGEQNAG